MIQVGADGPYQLTTSSTAACSCIGETFYNSGNDAQTAYPLPAITSLTLSTYAPFQPYVDTPQSANQYLVIWGNDLTADGESNPPYISVNGVGSSGGTISVTGFHLGSGWFVTETDSSGSSQINIPFWVDATATPGTYTLALATAGGSTSANFTVGDASPVITSISQNGIINSSFVVGNQVTMVISGQHFGTAQPNVAFPFGATWQSETYSDSVIQFNGFTATAAGSGYMNVMAEGYGNGFAKQNPNESQSASAAASATSPPAAIVAVVPARGMAGYLQPISIAGSNFGTAPPKITANGITVSNIGTPTGSNQSGVTASFAISASAAGGSVTVTLTPTTGNATPAQSTFFVQIPTSLIRATYSPGAPGGYGPLETPVNQPILNAADEPMQAANVCGVYRNLAYSVVDQENPPQSIQGPLNVDINESFSGFSGTSPAPTNFTQSVDLVNSPIADVIDNIALFHPTTTCLATNENQSFVQSFSLMYQGKTFPLTLTNSVSRGNFSGTLKDDINITTK